MTESEAIEELRDSIELPFGSIISDEASKLAIKSLEEIQQYRIIGTVEECREARERQKPKIPYISGDGYDNEGNLIYDMYDCPNCGKNYEVDYHDYKYCPECGQAIDRSDLDKLV